MDRQQCRNFWLEYKKCAENLNIPVKHTLDLIYFRQHLAEALILAGKIPNKQRGRASTTVSSPDGSHRGLDR